MKNIEELEKRISRLEYRLSVLEKFMDSRSTILSNHDESLMNSIRIEVVQNMKKEGFGTEEFKPILGTRFYQKT